MSTNELTWRGVYFYINYPYQCKVQFISKQTIHNVRLYKFKIVSRVQCFSDTDENMCSTFDLQTDDINASIYQIDEIINTIQDLQ